MPDITTAIKRVLRETGMDAVTTGSSAEDDATMALIDAMDYHNTIPWWFNRSQTLISTKNEQFRYKLPQDFMSMTEEPMYNSDSTISAVRSRLEYRPLTWAEEKKWHGGAHEMSINTGPPSVYSIDEGTNELLLIPVPNQDGESIEIRYLTDGNVPKYKWDTVSSSWVYYLPRSSKAITADFENGFLKHCFLMIVFKACLNMYGGTFNEGNESDNRTQKFTQMWMAEQNKKVAENARRASAIRIRPRIS